MSKQGPQKRSNATDEQTDLTETMTEMKRERKKEKKAASKIVKVVLTTLCVIFIILGISAYHYVQTGLKPLDSKSKNMVEVKIPVGSSNKGIANILEKQKVIKSAVVFNYYLKTNNLSNFQAGYYEMKPSMTLDQIAKELKKGGSAEPIRHAESRVLVREGAMIKDIAKTIGKETKFSEKDFLALMKNQDFLKKMQQKYPELLNSTMAAKDVRYRLEGYLFPATYDVYKKMTLPQLVENMLQKTNTVMTKYYPIIKEKGWNVQEVMTLASLVEREGVKEDDRRKIASVFYNRIDQNIALGSDISILYALDTHKKDVYNKDLKVDSPYNLYTNKGYGPGPFNSPGEQSIEATVNPDDTDYLYFVADMKTGDVYFSQTDDEHLKKVNKLNN